MRTVKILFIWGIVAFANHNINAINTFSTQGKSCDMAENYDDGTHDFHEYHDSRLIDFLDSLSHRDITLHDINVKEAKGYLDKLQMPVVLKQSVFIPENKDWEKLLALRTSWFDFRQRNKAQLQVLKFKTANETMVVLGYFVKGISFIHTEENKNRFYLVPGTEFIMISSDGTCFAGMNGDADEDFIYGFYHSPADGESSWVIDRLRFKTSQIYYDKKPTTQQIKGDILPLPSLSDNASFYFENNKEGEWIGRNFYDGEKGGVFSFLRGLLVEDFNLRIYPDPNALGVYTSFRSYFPIGGPLAGGHTIEVDLDNGGHVSGSLISDEEMDIADFIDFYYETVSTKHFFPFDGTFTYPHGEKVEGVFVDCEEEFDQYGGPMKLVQFGESNWYTQLPYPGNTTLSDNEATFLSSSTIKGWIRSLDFLEGVLLSQAEKKEEINNLTELYKYIEDRINKRGTDKKINSLTELYEYLKENYPTEFYEYMEDRIKKKAE